MRLNVPAGGFGDKVVCKRQHTFLDVEVSKRDERLTALGAMD